MKHTIAEFETNDGQTREVRIKLPQKLAWSRAARANGWPMDDPQQNAFVTWHAARAEGLIPESTTYEDFISTTCVDLDIDIREPSADDPAALDVEEGPTKPATH